MSGNVVVCIPWRETPDRKAAFDRCVKFWRDNGFDVVTGDSDPNQSFHCNRARNDAISCLQRSSWHSDVFIIADGDTLPEKIEQVYEAIEVVKAEPATVVWPYTTYVYVFPWEVGNPDLSTAQVVQAIDDMSGGIIVIHKDTFADLGGFDENFTPGCWGYDDLAFYRCAQTLTSTQRRPGKVFSFEHEANRDTTDANFNKRRFHSLYLPAIGHPEKMRAISKRRKE